MQCENTQKAQIFWLGADSREPFGQRCPDHPALGSVSVRQQFWEAELPGKEPGFSRTSRLQTHTKEFRTLSWKRGVAEEISRFLRASYKFQLGLTGGFHAVLQVRISAGFTAAAWTGERSFDPRTRKRSYQLHKVVSDLQATSIFSSRKKIIFLLKKKRSPALEGRVLHLHCLLPLPGSGSVYYSPQNKHLH